MTNDGNIYITISDTRGTGPGGTPDKKGDKKTKKEKESEYINDLFKNFLKDKAKQTLNTAVSNIGNFTGHYQAQREVQAVVSGVNKLGSLALGALAGFKMGGPVGAGVGFALATVSTIVTDVFSAISYTQQLSNQNREIEKLRNRSGLDPLSNGGRT